MINTKTLFRQLHEANELIKQKQSEIDELILKLNEITDEYATILSNYNYQLKLKGYDVMDFQTLSEAKELIQKHTNK